MKKRPNQAQHDRDDREHALADRPQPTADTAADAACAGAIVIAAHGGDGQAPLADPFDTNEPDAESVIEYQDGDDLLFRGSAEAVSLNAQEADQARRAVPGESQPADIGDAGTLVTDPIDPSGRSQSGYYEGTVATGGIQGPARGSSIAAEPDDAGHHDRGDLDDRVGSFNAEAPADAGRAGSESVRFDGSDVGLGGDARHDAQIFDGPIEGGSVAEGYVDQASPELALTDVGDAVGAHGADAFFEAWPPQLDETVQPDDHDAFTATDDLFL